MIDVDRIRRAQREDGSLYDRWFTRQVSRYVTAALMGVGMIRPNVVTVANTVLGLAAWTLIAFDTRAFVGVALVHVYAVLDSVDGELARATGRTSLRGMFLEDYSAYLMINGFWLAMGAYLAHAVSSSWPLIAAILYVSFGRSAMPSARRAILKSVAHDRPEEQEKVRSTPFLATAGMSNLVRFVLVDALHPSTVWAVTTTVLIVERLVSADHTLLIAVFSGYLFLSFVRELGVLGRFTLRGLSAP